MKTGWKETEVWDLGKQVVVHSPMDYGEGEPSTYSLTYGACSVDTSIPVTHRADWESLLSIESVSHTQSVIRFCSV